MLRPLRSADKSLEARELHEQTPQTNPTRASLDTDEVNVTVQIVKT